MLRCGDGAARGVGRRANLLGKRYQCSACEATVLVTNPGNGEITCHDRVMGVGAGEAPPSSD